LKVKSSSLYFIAFHYFVVVVAQSELRDGASRKCEDKEAIYHIVILSTTLEEQEKKKMEKNLSKK